MDLGRGPCLWLGYKRELGHVISHRAWVQAAGRLVGERGPPPRLPEAPVAPGSGRGEVHLPAGTGVQEGASDVPLLRVLEELLHVPGDVLEDRDEGAQVDVGRLRDEEVPELGDGCGVCGIVVGQAQQQPCPGFALAPLVSLPSKWLRSPVIWSVRMVHSVAASGHAALRDQP